MELKDSGRNPEGRRTPDRGDGTFLNPIIAGDHPDPSVLKDGDDYYLTFSSFESSPGLLIWHSRDLVNWTPLTFALERPPAIVFAVDLGIPWAIDPGHVVGEDGRRYLFLNGVRRVRLTDDGLATDGPVEQVYDGWRYPDEWVTEAYALEGPKLLWHDGFCYLVSAVGGTSGPATGHMVTVARSRSVHGPWEDDPANPLARTTSDAETWWSRGHATIVEGPAGDWWMVSHGYENGYRTLGRQALLEPVEWTEDGWLRATGRDLSAPIPKPLPTLRVSSGMALSDDFAGGALGPQWSFHSAAPTEADRVSFEQGAMRLTATGASPTDSSPLVVIAGDHAYEVTVTLTLPGEGCTAGLLLFFNHALFLGMGFDGTRMTTYSGGHASHWREPVPASDVLHLRIVNDRHIVTFFHSLDGVDWTRHGVRFEASGYHANTAGDLLSLRPALFAAGSGAAEFADFRYRALP